MSWKRISFFLVVLLVAAFVGFGAANAVDGIGPGGGPPGGGGGIGGGSGSGGVDKPIYIEQGPSGPQVNWTAVAAGTALCIVVGAVVDAITMGEAPSLTHVITYNVVPCVITAGAVVLLGIVGAPPIVAIILGGILYAILHEYIDDILEWLKWIFGKNSPDEANRQRIVPQTASLGPG